MATTLSKEEYLKRYLSDGNAEKKKKKRGKKDASSKVKRMRIIDDADGVNIPTPLDERKPVSGDEEEEEEGPTLALLKKTTTEDLALLGKFKRDAFRPAVSSSRQRHDSSDEDDGPITRQDDSDLDDLPRGPASSSQDADSDLDDLPRNAKRGDSDSDQDLPRMPQEEGGKARKTLSGATAGLQSASALRDEAKKIRDRQDRRFAKADAAELGKGAGTVFRDRGSGKRRDLGIEKAEAEAKAKREEELKAKYSVWNKGAKQVQNRQDKLQEMAKEADKPMARYEGDADLEEHLKEQELKEDPMLEYMQKKKARTAKVAHLPKYAGRPGPPNRFGTKGTRIWRSI